MRARAFCIILALAALTASPPVFGQYSECIGQEVKLQAYTEAGVVYVGVDKKSFNAIIGNLMAGDRANYLTLFFAHRGFEVSNFTKARILDVSFYEQAAQVQILEGPYEGRVGWVLIEHALGY
ncbi:MAG: hypothetical protein JSW40_09650 [Candidatus Omnitrophota bacterium]|nr:MAG: hypothetical protein JSW40_09650 [Candidatus Omnitrophota bacterium]